MEKFKEVWTCVTEGSIELTKREVLLGIGFCLTAGLLVGIVAAPFTRGISVGSYNGNHNSGYPSADPKKKKPKYGKSAIWVSLGTKNDLIENKQKHKKCCK